MNRREWIINGVFLAAILGVTALLATYRWTALQPPSRLVGPGDQAGASRAETGPPLPGIPPLERYARIQQVNIFRTIITPTPPPTPPPPTPTPYPPIAAVMSQFALLMMNPPSDVTLQNRQNPSEMIEWKVGQTRRVRFQTLELDVTLKSVDPNDFKATFTAPKDQTHTFSFFGGNP